jgi:ADP-ribose pyrophosphatase YjhB (NUDIX family)
MESPKIGKKEDGKAFHYSVGGVIKNDGKYLLIERMKPPFGFACAAGHVYQEEEAEEAVKREVENETGLKVVNQRLLFEEEVDWNWCKEFIWSHYWYVFECEVEGELDRSLTDTRSLKWYTPEELKELKLEKVWRYFFDKIKVL